MSLRMMGVFDKYHSWSINNPNRAGADAFARFFDAISRYAEIVLAQISI